MDQLDQLHAISDLHLGGAPGRQIFDQGPLLAGAIDRLRERAPDARVGLVLNGDLVDFLAAPGATYLDPFGAVAKLEAILTDAAFSPVWEALARFVRAPKRTLVIGIGNHDVELALPDVQERLLHAICGDSLEARARVRVAMDGSGYSCVVGARRVLCNSGTWVRLIRLNEAILADDGAFAPVFQALRGQTLSALDAVKELVFRNPTMVSIEADGGAVVGVLHRAVAAPGGVELVADPASRFALPRGLG